MKDETPSASPLAAGSDPPPAQAVGEIEPVEQGWRARVYEVIFEAETPGGKLFDVLLLVVIVLSIAAVVLESVESVKVRYGTALRVAEWTFTLLFTVEYALRLACVRKPLAYAGSFYGVVDLAAVLPTYLSIFLSNSQAFQVVRGLRLLRVFRIFKAARYVHEMNALVRAIKATRAKIAVFLFSILCIVLIMGSVMYVIEGQTNPGFSSIPKACYWAIVTVTTVGYGDIAPTSSIGQGIAALAMVLGYCLIIIPTGIFSVELVQASYPSVSTEVCPDCNREGHATDAAHCKFCGTKL